jgi:hypothetical protein
LPLLETAEVILTEAEAMTVVWTLPNLVNFSVAICRAVSLVMTALAKSVPEKTLGKKVAEMRLVYAM